jgi:hypothetical protein
VPAVLFGPFCAVTKPASGQSIATAAVESKNAKMVVRLDICSPYQAVKLARGSLGFGSFFMLNLYKREKVDSRISRDEEVS